MLEAFEIAAKAVSDPSRVRILKMLEGGELCVCQITTVLGLAPATVSKHLAALRNAGLLRQRRDGKWVHYRLSEQPATAHAAAFLALVRASLDGDPAVARDRAALSRPPIPCCEPTP